MQTDHMIRALSLTENGIHTTLTTKGLMIYVQPSIYKECSQKLPPSTEINYT